MNSKYRSPNPTDSWIAPEHARMGQGMRRYRSGRRDRDGLWLYRPGERVMPEPAILRQQRESEHLLSREPGCKCDLCVHLARVAAARSQCQEHVRSVV